MAAHEDRDEFGQLIKQFCQTPPAGEEFARSLSARAGEELRRAVEERSRTDLPRVGRRLPARTVVAVTAAAAVCLLVAIGLRGWHTLRIASAPGMPAKIGPKVLASIVAAPDLPADGNRAVLSAATARQRLRLEMILAQSEATWQTPEDEVLDRTVAQRMIEPDGNLEQLVQPLLAHRAEYERLLLARFDTFAGRQQLAAVEVLGGIGSEASVPRLVYESLTPAVHLPAVRALLGIADAGTLAWLAHDEPDPGLQEEITTALQSRGDEQTQLLALIPEGVRPCCECGLDWPQEWDLR